MDGGSSYTTLWIYFIPLTTHLKTIKMVRVVMCSLPSLKNKTQTPHLPWDYKAVCNRGSPVSLISYPLCSSLYTWYLPSFYVLSPWRAVSGIFLSKPLTTQVRASVLPPQRSLSWPTLEWPPPQSAPLSPLLFPLMWYRYPKMLYPSQCHIRRHVMSICPIPGDVNFDHLLKMVSVRFLHCNVTCL